MKQNDLTILPIGTKVVKKSNKPFKSGLLVNTIKDITINTQDPKRSFAYIFVEDDSVVNIDICKEYKTDGFSEPCIEEKLFGTHDKYWPCIEDISINVETKQISIIINCECTDNDWVEVIKKFDNIRIKEIAEKYNYKIVINYIGSFGNLDTIGEPIELINQYQQQWNDGLIKILKMVDIFNVSTCDFSDDQLQVYQNTMNYLPTGLKLKIKENETI